MNVKVLVLKLLSSPVEFSMFKPAYQMKKTSRDTGASGKAKIDYFQITRTSDPVESYDIKEFRKRMEAERKKEGSRAKTRR